MLPEMTGAIHVPNQFPMKKFFLLLSLCLTGIGCAKAQVPAVVTVSLANQTQFQSVHATQSIELITNFSSSDEGFEATITPSPEQAGTWSAVFDWGEPMGERLVGIHTHVLPDGNVLSWKGHNDNMSSMMETHTLQWTPATGLFREFMNETSNIFCSGHTFLPDGRLLVAGGHFDNNGIVAPSFQPSNPNAAPGAVGLNHTNLFNFRNTFTVGTDYKWQNPMPPAMAGDPVPDRQPVTTSTITLSGRRWYPTCTTLSTGEALVVAGQIDGGLLNGVVGYVPSTRQNAVPEVWTGTAWRQLTAASARQILPLYPMIFATPNGHAYYAGPSPIYENKYLDTAPGGGWIAPTLALPNSPTFHLGTRGQGTAAMYDKGKILLIGGESNGLVTNTTTLINLNGTGNTPAPQIVEGPPMEFARHHVNSTILPNGSVLVTGGSSVTSSGNVGRAVMSAEIWTPPAPGVSGIGSWKTVAPMKVPRMYHSTAVLLPDGRVLSTGGEEFIREPYVAGQDNHPDAEIYSPPYLFNTYRPVLDYAPSAVTYGQVFAVPSTDALDVVKVTWIRLSSVTHSFNMNQRLNYLGFTKSSNQLNITAPANSNDCPPGHYMLFAISSSGGPSVAKIVSISSSTTGCTSSVALNVSAPASTTCSGWAYASVSASINTGTDYRWFINNMYHPELDNSTSASIGTDGFHPNTTFKVEVNSNCGGTTTNQRSVFSSFPGNCYP